MFGEAYTGSVSIDTTEISLVSGTSTLQSKVEPGAYQLFVDFNALADGDAYILRVYEKVQSGSTKRVAATFVVSNAQGADSANWVSPSFLLLYGWDFTLIKSAGTARTIAWSIRKVA